MLETEESIREQESELAVEIEAQISSGSKRLKNVRLPSVTFDDFAKQIDVGEPEEAARPEEPEMTVALVCVFL